MSGLSINACFCGLGLRKKQTMVLGKSTKICINKSAMNTVDRVRPNSSNISIQSKSISTKQIYGYSDRLRG